MSPEASVLAHMDIDIGGLTVALATATDLDLVVQMPGLEIGMPGPRGPVGADGPPGPEELLGADYITVGDTEPVTPGLHDVWIDTN